ncbi:MULTISPECIES: hypothetical protein [unclassified Rhizobium]|nr:MULTISPECIES: hypothetical protein [unclassified Rhizobium]
MDGVPGGDNTATGIVPGVDPEGQASGMTAAVTMVGTRNSTSICWITA